MRITDIIRGVLDLVDQGDQQEPEVMAIPPGTGLSIDAVEEPCPACGASPCGCEQTPEPDLLAVIQQLAGLEAPSAEYANEPNEVVAPIGASFPGGDDVHQRKNPADIRTNAPSMYPNYQAK